MTSEQEDTVEKKKKFLEECFQSSENLVDCYLEPRSYHCIAW